MVADLQRAADLAHAVLAGPEDYRPDALFDLIGLFETLAPQLADVAESAQDSIYDLTPHRQKSFQGRRAVASDLVLVPK